VLTSIVTEGETVNSSRLEVEFAEPMPTGDGALIDDDGRVLTASVTHGVDGVFRLTGSAVEVDF